MIKHCHYCEFKITSYDLAEGDARKFLNKYFCSKECYYNYSE